MYSLDINVFEIIHRSDTAEIMVKNISKNCDGRNTNQKTQIEIEYPSCKSASHCLDVHEMTAFPYGLVVRIPPFHGGGRGSIPRVGVILNIL